MWKQDHLTTLTYHNKYIILMLYKIFHSFADNPLHAVPQALAIASELAISLRRWANIDNWHAECVTASSFICSFCCNDFSPKLEIALSLVQWIFFSFICSIFSHTVKSL